MKKALQFLFLVLLSVTSYAGRDTYLFGNGHNGALTVTSPTIINICTSLTNSISHGDTTVSVQSVSGFSIGDLVMIHKTQVQSTPVSGDQAWIYLQAGGVGSWEFARITNIVSNQLTLNTRTLYDYAVSGCQVLKVPEYTSVNIQAGGSIIPYKWDGSKGGIITFLCSGTVTASGPIDATGAGFRGGLNVVNSTNIFTTGLDAPAPDGGQKGEGFALNYFGATITGRGNLFNGAGGGNAAYGGGGGGGGQGSGGAGGGNFAGANAGKGGAGVWSEDFRLFTLGGGGGAGNGGSGVIAGGRGGGVIYVRAQVMTATSIDASMMANGENGTNTSMVNGGSPGGGGGGVAIAEIGTLINMGMEARGGKGGNALRGAGGGGGGGRVFIHLGANPTTGSYTYLDNSPGSSGNSSSTPGVSGQFGAYATYSSNFFVIPVPTITSPLDGAVITSDPLIVTGTGVDTIAVHIELDGTDVGRVMPVGGTYSYSLSSLPAGSHSIAVFGQYDSFYSVNSAKVTFTIPSNITPSYTLSSPQSISMCRNAFAKDLKPYLHVSDADTAQTLTWTQQSGPSHGTLVITGATAASGSTNRTPGGTITYQPTSGYGGADAFTIRVSDGIASSDMVVNVTVDNLSVSTVVTNVTCHGAGNGSITATASGGVAPYTYMWSTGNIGQTLSGRSGGTYHSIVDDAMGCEVDVPVFIAEPAVLSGTVTSASAVQGSSSTTLAYSGVTGSPTKYSIVYSSAAHTAGFTDVTGATLPVSPITLILPTGASAGVYTANLTFDSGSCSSSPVAFTVTLIPPNVTPSFVSTSPQSVSMCRNASAVDLKSYLHVSDVDAGQTLTLTQQSGPSHGTLVITGATTTSGSTNRTPGGTITYQPTSGYGGADAFTIRVSDGIASSDMVVNVTVNNLSVATAVTNITCNGANNGSIFATASGGVPPYDYFWSTGNTGRTLSNCHALTYHSIVYDAAGCSVDEPATVSEPDALVATASATGVSCFGGSNGTVVASVTGGTTPYTYTWSPAGGTLATATGLASGGYTVTVKDNHNCQTTATTTIAQPTALTATTAFTAVSCNGGSNGAASVAASGGTGVLRYIWSPTDDTTATVTGLTAGTYTVDITDGNLCQLTQTVTVTQPTAITGTTAKTDISCHGNNDGMASITASGGTGTLTYSWAPAGGASATATGLAGGVYTVTVTDDNSCVLKETATVVDPAILTASISAHTDVSCHGGSNGAASVTAGGGVAPYTYSWSPAGGTLATASGLSAGNYTVTVTDAHSCTATAAITIAEPVLTTASIAGTTTVCNNTGAEVYISSANGAVVNYKINGGTTQQAEIGAAGIDTIATGNLTAAASYDLVSVTVGGCTYPATGNSTVSVYPQATVNSITSQTVCNTANTNSVVFGGPVSGTTFTWTNNNTTIGLASSGADSFGAFEAVNTGTTAQTATVTVTPTANGCVGTTRDFTITVYPTPMLTSTLTPAAICNNTTFSYLPTSATVGTTYQWSRAAVTGISDAANNGTDNPDETLHNTTTDPVAVTYVYTLTANGCTNTQDVTVTVNPTPVLTSTLTAAPVCNNTVFNYTPTSATVGTAYQWSRAAVTGISNAANTGNDDPAETLSNTTTDPIVVTYVYTLTANGCTNTQSVDVTVNPTPVLTTTLTAAPVCDSSLFSYDPVSATVGTTYQWSRATVTGISNAAATGADNPGEYLVNTTPDPVNVQYVYTLTANSCTNTQSVTVTVYPKPLLSTTLTPAAICDSTMFAYTPNSLTAGTTYVWSRDAVAGISNPANADNTDPDETLDNTTVNPVAVTYVYTLTANGCRNTQNVTVVVNPTPVLTSTLTVAPLCDSTLFSYVPTSATTGTTFTWSRDTMDNILNASATGTDNPMEYLVNIAPYPVNVMYTYTLTANGCSHTETVQMTVNPKPLLSSTLAPASICDSATFSYVPASLTSGTTYNWSRAAVTGIANAAGTGTDNPLEVLYNTTADSIAVNYVYTLTAYGCSNTQNVQVYVKPTPKLSSTLSPAAICNSTVFSYTPTSATGGTAFTWTRALVTGISNAAGTGTDNPMETLTNTLVNPVNVPYVFSMAAAGCTHSEVVTVRVNATPKLSSSMTGEVCSTAPFSYAPTSATTGTTYAWTRATAPGISNAAGSGTGSVNEVLINQTNLAKTVTYRYTLTANGCSNIQNVVVTVDPTPVIPVIAIHPDAALCSKSQYMNFGASIAAADSTNYNWTAQNAVVYAQGAGNTNAVVSFPNSGTANVILTAGVNGYTCYTRDTFTVAVSTSEAPNAEVYYIHDHFIYTDNTVNTYQWGYDDAATLDSVMFTGQVDQNYYDVAPDFTNKKYWVITTKDGCLSKSYYNAPTGVVNVNSAVTVNLAVVPNPASNYVSVAVEGVTGGNDEVELTDLTGKTVITEAVHNNKAQLNVNNLASGIYVVTYYHNGVKAGTAKLVKE